MNMIRHGADIDLTSITEKFVLEFGNASEVKNDSAECALSRNRHIGE
jgi:hypothetical protein